VGLSRWNWKGLTLGELVDSMVFERRRKSEREWRRGRWGMWGSNRGNRERVVSYVREGEWDACDRRLLLER